MVDLGAIQKVSHACPFPIRGEGNARQAGIMWGQWCGADPPDRDHSREMCLKGRNSSVQGRCSCARVASPVGSANRFRPRRIGEEGDQPSPLFVHLSAACSTPELFALASSEVARPHGTPGRPELVNTNARVFLGILRSWCLVSAQVAGSHLESTGDAGWVDMNCSDENKVGRKNSAKSKANQKAHTAVPPAGVGDGGGGGRGLKGGGKGVGRAGGGDERRHAGKRRRIVEDPLSPEEVGVSLKVYGGE